MKRIVLWSALALALPTPLAAQTAEEETAKTEVTTVEPVVATPVTIEPVSTWIAGWQGGYVGRDGGAGSPYATASVTQFHGAAYLRGALTVYRSTLRQVDAALPSTYYIASIGAGGNFDDWVIDAHASYGRQRYGLVETALGKRQSAFSGSDYLAAGLRAGRMFRPAPSWYVTPTLQVEYVDTRSLRDRFDGTEVIDFEVPERALSAGATLRVDRTLGKDQQSYVGLALSHYETDNGLTGILPVEGGGITTSKKPDSWEQLDASATVRLRPNLWLDLQVGRSFGAYAGDNTSVTVGLRIKL
jgi:hypothetical protein